MDGIISCFVSSDKWWNQIAFLHFVHSDYFSNQQNKNFEQNLSARLLLRDLTFFTELFQSKKLFCFLYECNWSAFLNFCGNLKTNISNWGFRKSHVCLSCVFTTELYKTKIKFFTPFASIVFLVVTYVS